MNNINKVFDEHMNEYQKLFKNYNDLTSDLNSLNDKYLNKEKECLLQQKVIHDLRNENKKIILLNKNIKEKEKEINDLKKIIKNNNEEIYNHQKENKYLNEQIQNYSNNEDDLFKTRKNLQDYENVINQIKINFNKKLKNKELLIQDYKNNILKNQSINENLITYIIQQIQVVQDNFDKYNPAMGKDDDDIMNNYSKINENDSKYELIHQNFVLLINKLKEFKRKNNFEINKMRNILEEEINNKKKLLNNIDLEKIRKTSIENSIIELKKIVEDKNNEIKQLNIKINSIISENTKNIENNNENDISKEENKIFNDFFKEFIDIITNYYIDNINKKNNIFQIQAFPNYSILDPKQKKLYDIIDTINILINYINSITNQLMSLYNTSRYNFPVSKYSNFANNNYINNSNIKNNSKENTTELKKKVKEMSDLLVQSNYYLDISRQENIKMKEKYKELKNNYNALRNFENSKNIFNSENNENIENNDISYSKNYMNNSHIAVNQSNQNNMDLYGNSSNSNNNNFNRQYSNNNFNNMNNNIEIFNNDSGNQNNNMD